MEKPITVRLPKALVDRVDALADDNYISRSDVIRRAIIFHLQEVQRSFEQRHQSEQFQAQQRMKPRNGVPTLDQMFGREPYDPNDFGDE